jgi:predicted regulator of Ras-like GTPase activity (Roadblock/LC7/MglB family)
MSANGNPVKSSSGSDDIEGLQAILNSLSEASRDIEGALVISRDGLPMMAVGRHRDADKAVAACAALFSAANSTAAELEGGTPDEIVTKGPDGYLLIVRAGQEATLAVLARPEANLGLLFLAAHRAADAIQRSL